MPETVNQSPRLLDRVRVAIRAKHYSHRTEAAYVHWIRRFILFHDKRHPMEMSEPEVVPSSMIWLYEAAWRQASRIRCPLRGAVVRLS